MEPFGKRVRQLRAELGLSQRNLGLLADLDQARLSRIEKGEFQASVAVIDRLAAALQRSGRDLAAGTDREGHYFAQALSPDQAAQERAQQALIHDFDVLLFESTYERIVRLFEALHSGPYIVVNIDGIERVYLDLRRALDKIREALGDTAPAVFLPEHLEPTSDDEVLSWDEWEHPQLRRSLLDVRAFVHSENPSDSARATSAKGLLSALGHIDETIEQIRTIQDEHNADWLKRATAAAKRSPLNMNSTDRGAQ